MSAGGLYVRPLINSEFTINNAVGTFRMPGNEMDYEPGFQASLGYQVTDNWDHRLKFKHFSAKEKATFGSLSSSLLTAFVQQEYQLKYDVLDFELGKQFALSDSVSLRLSGGLRYAALKDNYKTTERNNSALAILLNQTSFTTTKNETDSSGR